MDLNIIRRKPIKTLTNQGELCKQYFSVAFGDGLDAGLIIRKLVLTKDTDLYLIKGKCELLREFKDVYLVQTIFSIKLSTLQGVVKWISEL